MLKFLTLEGYIQHYCYYNINNNRTKRFIKIFLSYSGQWIKYPAINFLKKEKKSNFNNFLSKNKIEKFFLKNKKQGHNILTTTSGIINSKEAFLINKGGKFLYSIN